MTSQAASAAPSIVLTLVVAGSAIGVWSWRARMMASSPPMGRVRETWEHVKQAYPAIESTPSIHPLALEQLEIIVTANPFAPARSFTASPNGGSEESGEGDTAPAKPSAPIFVYKGRIHVGHRLRAIIEDSTTHTTHFLEVGQDVAGFKVLDIAENQVVLSDSTTQHEVVISLASSRSPAP